MNRFVKLPQPEQTLYFEQASDQMNLSPEAVEKDFWVVWVLSRLFSSELLASKILFKGGTSLSKVFGLIDRFSEDIDLILDWNEVVVEDPMAPRSKTKQDAFNKTVSLQSQEYIATTFLPEVLRLVDGVCSAEIEENAPDVINLCYPSSFAGEYLRPEIRLEIGPLAQWIPNAQYKVVSYAAEAFPDLFETPACLVNAIKAERTFWEKATILHHEAHRPEESKVPPRYSRHYYDLHLMAQAEVKQCALSDLGLLKSVVEFKKRFYPRGWAQYDLARPGTMKLIPSGRVVDVMRKDYDAMQDMIFGYRPSFDKILAGLNDLEGEINALESI
ncbi:MAG: nucleotidyl transferase AbiEii/AbiGii toxin family protein [Verrucomicrobiota bacterium]